MGAAAEAAAAAAEEVIKQPNFPRWDEAFTVVIIAILSALASEGGLVGPVGIDVDIRRVDLAGS